MGYKQSLHNTQMSSLEAINKTKTRTNVTSITLLIAGKCSNVIDTLTNLQNLSCNMATNHPASKYHFHIHKSQISFSYGVETMGIYKMQLDTAVREKRSSHSLQLSPQDTLEQHETPDKLQWLSHHMASEKSSRKP